MLPSAFKMGAYVIFRTTRFKKEFRGDIFAIFLHSVFFMRKGCRIKRQPPISVVKLRFFVAVVEIIIFNYSLFEIGEFEIKLILCRI